MFFWRKNVSAYPFEMPWQFAEGCEGNSENRRFAGREPEGKEYGLHWELLSQIPTSAILPWGLRIANAFFAPGATPPQMLVARFLSEVLAIFLFSAGFLTGGKLDSARADHRKQSETN